MSNITDKITKRWDSTGLLHGLKPDDAINCALILEYSVNYLKEKNSIDIAHCRFDLIIPFIRRIFSKNQDFDIDDLISFSVKNITNSNVKYFMEESYQKGENILVYDYEAEFLVKKEDEYLKLISNKPL